MSIFRDEPYRTKRFVVDLGNGDPQGFSEVILPSVNIQAIDYREGNDKTGFSHKLAGHASVGNLVLKRGFKGRLDLYEWFQQTIQEPEQARRNVVVQLLSENGTEVVTTWKLRNAWPIGHSFSPLEAKQCDLLIEEVIVACESIEME